jgi:hypothetical protein
MRSDNKVCDLATVCFPWQQWIETSVWFHDAGISAIHSCVIDLWQSLSEWQLLCLNVFWCLASWQCTCSHGTVCEGVLASKQITLLGHPPYSLDLAPWLRLSESCWWQRGQKEWKRHGNNSQIAQNFFTRFPYLELWILMIHMQISYCYNPRIYSCIRQICIRRYPSRLRQKKTALGALTTMCAVMFLKSTQMMGKMRYMYPMNMETLMH